MYDRKANLSCYSLALNILFDLCRGKCVLFRKAENLILCFAKGCVINCGMNPIFNYICITCARKNVTNYCSGTRLKTLTCSQKNKTLLEIKMSRLFLFPFHKTKGCFQDY